MDYSEGSSAESGTGPRRSDARPISRRGYRDSARTNSGVFKNANMRPASAYRGSTASRMPTAGFGPAPPTAGRQPTAMTGFSMIDRPITQHGLSGLRTGTARGFRTRQLQDKRYWEEMMQVKVREMKSEIARLHEQAEIGERERSAKKHYEKRVKELAQELTDLQGRLADYNTAIRIACGEASKQSVVQQTKELEENNKKLQDEVEQVFVEKQRKEMQLAQLKEQMDKETTVISELLTEMTPEQKDQYNELESKAAALREEVEQARTQIDILNKEKDEFNKEISGYQIKVHLLELHRRLAAAEEQRDQLKKEMNNRLEPHEEREKLLQQVREDNAAISTLDGNASNLKEQIRKVQELIEQAEQDLEEGNSERHQKYRELKKREETMDTFLNTFEENLKKEKERIEQFEKDIVFSLEHSSANIDMDLSEIDNLKQKEGYISTFDDGKKTVESLNKDFERLQENLKKAEAARARLATELQTLPEKTLAMRQELLVLSNLDKLREEGEEQKKKLSNQVDVLRDKLKPTENAILEASANLKKLQENLEGNEMYAKLNSLEDQKEQLESRKTVLEDDIASITNKSDYDVIKKQAMEELANLNRKIIEDLNTVKSF